MDEKIECPYCGRGNVVKKGVRRLKKIKKQLYYCKDCCHKFSLSFDKKKFDIKFMLKAVCLFNQGYRCEEIRDIMLRKHKVDVSTSSISRWVENYDLGYSIIRQKITEKYNYPFIVGRMFKHSGLIYNFKYHKGKLKEFGKFSGLKSFIFNLSKGTDERYFTTDSKRCSQISKEVSANIKVFDNTKLSRVVGSALKIIKSNKQRHSVVENLMLSCDRDTVAVEVPVWYWDKANNVGICGHIDVLQVKYGKTWILDYKPNAEQENVDKVVSQLFNYALGLSFRTGVGLRDIRCGWFDEAKIYVFDAGKVRLHG